MTNDMDQSWYIDAWCPVDGLAFASRRQRSILHAENSERSLYAKETVYLCPPFFEPEQIGSLATALAATRGHFQTGFYRSEQEVAFPTLAAVIATVKRVYRGGGSHNLPGLGLPLPITPVDRSPGAVTPDSLLNNDIQRAWIDLKRHFVVPACTDLASLRHSTTAFLRCATGQGVLAKLALLSVAPVLNRFALDTATTTANFETLGCWISILARMGCIVEIDLNGAQLTVWHQSHGFEENLPSLRQSRRNLESLQWASNPLFYRQFDLDAQQVMDTMHRIPIPVEWPAPYSPHMHSRYALVPTFGALFCLVTASHQFLQDLSSPLHFAPIILASMALSTSWANRTRYSDNFEEVEATTCEWLAQSLPTVSLGSVVDEVIHWFSIEDLENRAPELAAII
jgi:hypothetical protein